MRCTHMSAVWFVPAAPAGVRGSGEGRSPRGLTELSAPLQPHLDDTPLPCIKGQLHRWWERALGHAHTMLREVKQATFTDRHVYQWF